jgi:malonyl-CoA decarboxylase
VASFAELLDQIVERGRSLIGRSSKAEPLALCAMLLSRRGEASGVAIAREIVERLETATAEGRRAFLVGLASGFGADVDRLAAAVDAWRRAPSPSSESALHFAAEPRRQELIRRLNQAPGGTAALVRLRADLIELIADRDAPELEALDDDFAHLFGSWFNRGFLVLRRIDWASPANVLEKIIAYEAVHEIRSWDDLRNRLEPPDRRCFAFFHPRLVDEPLIFVEVALTKAIPDSVQPLLDLARTPLAAREATTAVFYSISNTQPGLKGVSFGAFLIKQVVDELKRELPRLATFVTLSPAPGFAQWLAQDSRADEPRLGADGHAALAGLAEPDWHLDPDRVETLRKPLLSAAATYLVAAKGARNRPLDTVARFHLGNGARLERLAALGDVSPKGLAQAHGLMVNYLYDLDDIEKNHEAFAERGEIAAAAAVLRLVRAAPASKKLEPR